MSPVPPPAGYITPSDDWSNDASFDFDSSPSTNTFALNSSPGSSSSSSHSPQGYTSHHRKSTSGATGHVSSPLRQSHISLKPEAGSDDFDDFDLPDSFPALASPRILPQTKKPASHAIRNLQSQVIGQGPTGIGTITRLGAGNKVPSVPTGTVLARAKAIEKAWENDVDFDSLEGEDEPAIPSRSKRLTLSPPKRRVMPGPDALDDIELGDDNEATLKAGATIKALLPPKKHTVEDNEADFVLPLNVKNLTLATQGHSNVNPRLGARLPESPSTSTSGKKSDRFSWGDDSPKRQSETSMTSVTDGMSKVGHEEKIARDSFGDEEDMEDGLVLPSAAFFSSGRTKELNRILDRKRRAPYHPSPSHKRQGTEESFRGGDESIEDGLVLDNPRAELSRKRLDRAVKARTPNSFLKKGCARPNPAKEARERAWEKQREQGWGRHIPSQPLPSSSQRSQSSLGFTGRSQSSGTSTLRDLALGPTSRQQGTTPSSRDSTLNRTRMHSMAMLPPPIPESHDQITTPSSTSRLRHQKSHYHMPAQSPSLARKPSLASLQDAMSSGSVIPPVPQTIKTPSSTPSIDPNASRYHHSTSRLTMPTSSSRAKSRPPLHSVFPKTEFTASSSASSVASSSRDGPTMYLPRSKSGKGSWGKGMAVPRTMDMPRKFRRWDGSELDGIEDIPVDSGKGSGSFGRSKSRKALDMQAMGAKPFSEQVKDAERRRQTATTSNTVPTTMRNKPKLGRRMPALISHKGRNDKVIVVGDMTFNPRTQRWEGNEALLRDFDPPTAPSVRPALITHYTGSSMGGVRSPTGPGGGTHGHAHGHGHGHGSGSGAGVGAGAGATATVRIVGNMMFDPEKMCWVSTLAPEDDEPDPFEGMADDEDGDDGGGRGGTITRAMGKRLVAVGGGGGGAHLPSSTFSNPSSSSGGNIGMKTSQSSSAISTSQSAASGWSSRLASESSLSAISWDDRLRSEQERQEVIIPPGLMEECKEAEERHRREMRGWLSRTSTARGHGHGIGEGEREMKRDRERREEKRLWEIRVLATT